MCLLVLVPPGGCLRRRQLLERRSPGAALSGRCQAWDTAASARRGAGSCARHLPAALGVEVALKVFVLIVRFKNSQ